jgi:hypothetical protein
MFLTFPAYQIDSTDGRQYAVVCEATSRKEVSDYLATYSMAKCDVFKESGVELYRGICEVTTVTSDANLNINH